MPIISKIHAERTLDFFESYDVGNMKIVQEGDIFLLEKIILRTKGCAKIQKKEKSLTVTLKQNIYGCDLRFHLEKNIQATGMGALIKICNVKKLIRISIGYTDDNTSDYTHIKVTNAILNEWFCIEFDYNDIIFYINNQKIEKPKRKNISDIRLYLYMEPQFEDATISVQQLFVWEQKKALPTWIQNINPEFFNEQLIGIQISYWQAVLRNIDKFDVKNTCYLCYGDHQPKWDSAEKFPENMMEKIEYRFTWHSWQYVGACILKFLDTNDHVYILSAVEFASNWFSNSYFERDSDFKYTWYDHSVPIRLETMVMLYVILVKNKLNSRFLEVLKSVIYRHALLLTNESFYAFNQLFRWHNHASYQDMVLFFTSSIMNEWPCAKYWQDISVSRIIGFYENLLIKENETYISVENSIGYHRSLLSMMHKIDQMFRCTNIETTLTDFFVGMQLFIESVKYPNGYFPTFGDTYRKNHLLARCEHGERIKEGVNIFEKAGYAVIRGTVDNTFYQLTFICSSQTITHKHEDNCSFSLFLDSIEWLIDPSYHSYDPDQAIPKYLRSSYAHNAVTLKDLPYNITNNSTTLCGKIHDSHTELHMSHANYNGYEVKRVVRGHVFGFDYAVNDSVHCLTGKKGEGKSVSARIMFHCGHGVVAKQNKGNVTLTHKDSRFRVIIEGIQSEAIIHFNNIENDFCKIRGISGLGFGEISPINTVEFVIDNFSSITYSIRAEHN